MSACVVTDGAVYEPLTTHELSKTLQAGFQPQQQATMLDWSAASKAISRSLGARAPAPKTA
jgi:hypothetical protein